MTALTGKRILVVEDNYMIALDLADTLRQAGASIVGPVGRPSDALALITAGEPIDVAVLDIDLHGEPSYVIADALIARGVFFVFATGFSSEALAPQYLRFPRIEKPVGDRALLAALSAGS